MVNRSMKRILLFSIVVFGLAFGGGSPGQADSHKGIELSHAVVVTAEIVAIDRADRVVTLVGPRGNVVDVVAGDEVRNFDQIAVGDSVKVTYYESVALYLGQPGSQPEVQEAEVMARAAHGEKPAAMALGTIDVSVVVLGKNPKAREVTLEMPRGHVLTAKAQPDDPIYDKVRVGDTVHARVTRAVAILVEAH